MIEIGCCHGPDDLDSIFLREFDYREVTLSVFEDRHLPDPAASSRTLQPPVRIVLGVFPAGTSLFDGESSLQRALDRVAYVTDVVARSGARGLAFGAGAVRTIPPGLSRREGEQILSRVLHALAAGCAAAGAELFVENLPADKSGMFNTLDEIVRFMDDYSLPSTSILYDLRSAAAQREAPQEAILHIGRIGHVHVPFPDGEYRNSPYDTGPLVNGLLKAGYARAVSLEPVAPGLGPEIAARRKVLAQAWS
ncbi:MAG TPA: TIM barrel protein [Vicinamibacterales bacterium]|nr:TIM barrel protein [Vicinamibacterales bacterium]